ncbi:MAG TPA: hypothetical protein VEH52_11265 [Gaiellaceae bacterium]|nr:hypothetical protein [Gaiellaceae bacterium]
MASAIPVLLALPLSVELLARRMQLAPETLRKLAHIGGALLAVPLPLLLTYREIAGLGLVFAAIMAVSLRLSIFAAVHGVERASHGEVFFPLGVAGLAMFFPDWTAYMYGVLVLGLADGLAALVGTRYGRRKIVHGKSVWGCATFFAVAYAVGIALQVPPSTTLVIAASATAVEAMSRHGFDNIAVPLVVGLLVTVI